MNHCEIRFGTVWYTDVGDIRLESEVSAHEFTDQICKMAAAHALLRVLKHDQIWALCLVRKLLI